jgi:hypothetical protein
LSVRVSELPVVTTLNDDDFIIVNTQNIVTQGIETEFFIGSLFGRDLEFTGTPTFSGGLVVNDDVTINSETTINNNITLNGDLSVNGTISIKLDELSDVNVTTATSGQFLAYNAGAKTWVATDAPAGTPGGNNNTLQFKNVDKFGGAPEVTYGNTSYGIKGIKIDGGTDVLELTGARVNSTGTLNVVALNDIIIRSSTVKINHGNTDRITVDASGVALDGTTTTTTLIATDFTTTTLVAGGLTYPTSDGNSGQVLATDGAGNIVFQTNSASPGVSIPFQASPPLGSNAGELWMNSNTYKLYVWDGSWIATS